MQINWKAILTGSIIAALLAPINFRIGPVPITMQTFVLFTLAATLGKNTGLWIAIIYLLLGSIGLPVFAGFQAGHEKMIGPTAGFLWALPAVAYYIGWACEKGHKDFFHFIIYFFRAHVIWLIPGFLVLYLLLPEAKLWDALIRILPGILLKSITGGLISIWLIKKLPPSWTEVSSSS